MTTKEHKSERVQREATLRWIPIDDMKVSSHAQRGLNQSRVDKLAARFDLEQLGNPTVNLRDGHYWVIDGQHRIEALRQLDFAGYDIECWTYEGLTEDEEAEKFLKLNDVLSVDVFAKFNVGVKAGRPDEVEILRIVHSLGLSVSRAYTEGSIRAVGTLQRVYTRSGSEVLERTLRIIRDAYGDAGFEAPIIDGIGHLVGRFGDLIDDEAIVERLSKALGGPSGLVAKAEVLRRQTGSAKGQAVAAAAVETINRGRGGKKLPPWWKA